MGDLLLTEVVAAPSKRFAGQQRNQGLRQVAEHDHGVWVGEALPGSTCVG